MTRAVAPHKCLTDTALTNHSFLENPVRVWNRFDLWTRGHVAGTSHGSNGHCTVPSRP
ncbi:hypothetical protein SV7mr_03730 [Stieleria bergensis]|uniref:Uncharacterized protein n=1 Tax=Stieleria bergensis TaxID=2528025 RepID=A0A517SP45_9BACT|nr:hypothetical protein SV7mr_03730 [Planctomycetes bacterium SV_7m_r]